MTTSANQDPQEKNIIEGVMRGMTNMANELARTRKHTREAMNENMDEMCRQHKEDQSQFDSLFMEVQHLRRVVESLVHHYHFEEQDD